MSEVTREEFDQLVARVEALEEADHPDQPVPPPPLKALTLGRVTAKVTGTSYTLTGTGAAGKNITLKYAQIAVRGPGAADLGHRPGLRVTVDQKVTFTGSMQGATPGQYTTWLAYSLDGEAWTTGPRTTFTVAPTPAPVVDNTAPPSPTDTTERRVPRVGRSGLPFNSTVFTGDNTVEAAERHGSWRGRPMDGVLWFTDRDSWDGFRRNWTATHRDWLAAGRLLVVTLPHAPQSEGSQMNQRGADNAYANQQRELGKWMADFGLNSRFLCLRINWESNGDWYPWSAKNGGADVLRRAFTNSVTNLRAGGLTKVRFSKCWNKGPSQAGSDFEAFPGGEYCDVVSVDAYDMWRPSYSDDQWKSEINRRPGLQTVANFARDKGVLWSLDEGGNTHGDSDAYGGDNPFYYEKLFQFATANAASCAWVNTYDHTGAPASLRHDFASNPRSAETYKKLWGKTS